MCIRSTAKAVIINDNKILLNRAYDERHGAYYTLPGGGQNKYEELIVAVVRECLEETGYIVIPKRYAAISEEISLDPDVRENFSEYAHRMYHFFICELKNNIKIEPTAKDKMQTGIEWIEMDELKNIMIFPSLLKENILDIIDNKAPIFLGSEYSEHYHA